MNYYPFHVGDYVTHTAHLSPLEDIAYRRLLDICYITEAPLPPDVASCARLVRMRDNETEVGQVLSEFFVRTEDGWVSERCNDEIAAMRVKQEKAKASAAASVAARQAKVKRPSKPKSKPVEPSQSVGLTDVQRTLNERSTTVELPTPTPIPINSVAKATDGVAVDGVVVPDPPAGKTPDDLTKAELWTAGKSLLAASGMPKAQCGSFVGKLVKDYGDAVVVEAVRSAVVTQPADPVEYLKATCQRSVGTRRSGRAPAPENFDAVDYGEERFI